MRGHKITMALVFGAGIMALLSCMPLSWGVDLLLPKQVAHGVKIQSRSGTIWHGQVRGIKTSMGPINHVGFRFSPKGLLTNQPYFIKFDGPGYQGQANLGVNKIADTYLTATLQNLVVDDLRFKGVAGNVALHNLSLQMKNQQCSQAAGKIETNFLSRNENLWQWHGPNLSGDVKCEDGVIMADLNGEDASVKISSRIQAKSDGWYQAEITVAVKPTQSPNQFSTSQSLPLLLPLLGFSSSVNSEHEYILREQGNFIRGKT